MATSFNDQGIPWDTDVSYDYTYGNPNSIKNDDSNGKTFATIFIIFIIITAILIFLGFKFSKWMTNKIIGDTGHQLDTKQFLIVLISIGVISSIIGYFFDQLFTDDEEEN